MMGDVQGDMQGDSAFSYELKKADPNKTYYIDVAFVVSESVQDGIGGFRELLALVNQSYQYSGVNVEFRVADVVPFSDYKDYLACPVDSLESLDATNIMKITGELAPRIQKDTNADLIYVVTDKFKTGTLGMAEIRMNNHISFKPHLASRWASIGHISLGDIRSSVLQTEATTEEEQVSLFYSNFIKTLAHEFGHNLGLHHDWITLLNQKTVPPKLSIFHPNGYGYMGMTTTEQTYGTIMSYTYPPYQDIPLFSMFGSGRIEDICAVGSEGRWDNILGVGFCPTYTGDREEIIQLGGLEPNLAGTYTLISASEALQYTIEDASNYSTANVYATPTVVTDVLKPNLLGDLKK